MLQFSAVLAYKMNSATLCFKWEREKLSNTSKLCFFICNSLVFKVIRVLLPNLQLVLYLPTDYLHIIIGLSVIGDIS